MRCRQCGREIPAGKAFCAGCGAATATAGPTTRGRKPASGGAPRAPGRAAPGLSVLWIIIPTIAYAVLSLNATTTVMLAALGVILKLAQDRPELPPGVRPYLPLIQPVAAFLLLGGSAIPVVVFGVLGVVVVQQRDALIPTFESWWRIQQALPRGRRYVLAIVFTLAIGYGMGTLVRKHNWIVTSASVTVGTVVTFLFTFDPPPALRRRGGTRPARGRR